MTNPYSGLATKSPKDAVEIVGNVEKHNYLAHTIREIELAILLTQSHHHLITTRLNETTRQTEIMIHPRGSDIMLAYDLANNELLTRLTIAHELGHLVYNFDKLKGPDVQITGSSASQEEEVYAWEFAARLIDKKSKEHKENIEHGNYIHTTRTIKATLAGHLKDKNPSVYALLEDFLEKHEDDDAD